MTKFIIGKLKVLYKRKLLRIFLIILCKNKRLSNRIALESNKENAEFLKDEYENLNPETCTESQKLVQRVAKISAFYVKDNIELYDISQRVSIMSDECQEIEEKFDFISKRFKEVAKKIEEYKQAHTDQPVQQ